MAASALIVAGGSGLRFGRKKQFIRLGGVPVLRRTTDCFDVHPSITNIVVVVPEEDLSDVGDILDGITTPLTVTAGGATRQESVWNGLQVLAPCELVLIHDGVRPLVTGEIISRVIDGIEGLDACIPGLALADTIKEVEGTLVTRTIPRDHVYQVQTPQAFRTERILEAHARARDNRLVRFTDDSALIEEAGGKVGLVPGDPFNIKITLKEDLSIAEALLRCRTESA